MISQQKYHIRMEKKDIEDMMTNVRENDESMF